MTTRSELHTTTALLTKQVMPHESFLSDVKLIVSLLFSRTHHDLTDMSASARRAGKPIQWAAQSVNRALVSRVNGKRSERENVQTRTSVPRRSLHVESIKSA